MSWGQLDGERIQSGSITIPYWGALAGDVLLASSAQVAEQTTLTLGNLTCAVHVVRQASFSGSRSFRIVGGFGGWRKTVDRRYYASPASLTLSTVLHDVATEVGETVSVPASRLLGTQFVRLRGPAVRVLEQLATDWWISPAGVTTIGPRDTSRITTPLTVVSYSGGRGRFEIATEDMASWMPGRTFVSQTITEPVTVGSVSITLGNDGKSRIEILNTTPSSPGNRLYDPIDELIQSSAPDMVFAALWECTIVAVNGSGPWTLDVTPTSPACPLPGMTAIEYRPSLPGAKCKPGTGGLCTVAFLNMDPQRPIIVGFDTTQPDQIDIGAGSELAIDPVGRVVRYGDTIQVPSIGAYVLVPGTTPPTEVSKVSA